MQALGIKALQKPRLHDEPKPRTEAPGTRTPLEYGIRRLVLLSQYPSPNIIPSLPPRFPNPLTPSIIPLHRIRIRLQIHLPQLHNLRPFQSLPTQIHNQHDRQLDIQTKKGHRTKRRTEATPSLNQNEK